MMSRCDSVRCIGGIVERSNFQSRYERTPDDSRISVKSFGCRTRPTTYRIPEQALRLRVSTFRTSSAKGLDQGMRLVSLNETLIAGVGVRAIHNTCAAFAQAIPFARRSRLNARSRAGPSDPDAGSSDPAAGSLKSRIHTERADQPSSKPVDQRRADGSFPSSKPPALSHSKARSPLSAVHAPSNSLSAPRVSQIPRSRSPETASPILRFPAAASTAPVTQSRTSDDSDWPWRPVPCSNPVMTLESRVIFSRPFQSYFDRWPSAVWLAYIIPGTLIVYGVILPYILPIPPPEEGEGKLVGSVCPSQFALS